MSMNAFGRVIAGILAGIMIFIFPLQYIASSQEQIIDNHVHSITTEFVDEILLQGFLTKERYLNYINELDNTNRLYDVELIHSKPIIGYELGHNEADQVSKVSAGNKTEPIGGNIYTELSGEINNKKNQDQYQLLSTHVHTDACYNGDKHTHTSYGGSCYTYYNNQYWVNHTHTSSCYTSSHSHNSNCYTSRQCSGYITSSYTCSSCGRSFASSARVGARCGYYVNVLDCDIPVVNELTCTLGNGYWAGSSGYNLTCGKTAGSYYLNNTLVNSMCSKVVTGIIPTHGIQQVIQGEDIITTATATYLDGHIATVNCSSDYTGVVGNQAVKLTYAGVVQNAKTIGSVTCIMTIITEPKTLPEKLVVIPSSYSVNNGIEPTYEVKVIYDDGTYKIVTSDYVKTGFTKGAGRKEVTFTYTENEKLVSTTVAITVNRNTKTCINGHIYELDDYDSDHGCSICSETIKNVKIAPEYITVKKGSGLPIQLTVTYLDGFSQIIETGWTSNYDSNKLGNQLVTVIYKEKSAYVSVIVVENFSCLICGTEYEAEVDGSDPGCPICSKKVVSLKATPDTKEVPLGDALEIVVTATFLDGHSQVVNGWTSNFNSFKVGAQQVTIYYETITTTINATVLSENQTTCPICNTVYNPIQYPNGCPICSKKVMRIQASMRNGGNQVQIGSDLDIALILYYQDGHREYAYNDWNVEGYNPYQLGSQTIYITYQEYQTLLKIEVVNSIGKIICINGHEYYLNDNGSDPGCPYCMINNSEEIHEDYFRCIYTLEILKELNSNEIYYFSSGDYFTVSIIPKGQSYLDKLQSIFYTNITDKHKFSCGGMIYGTWF
jgi:DNA-directed RNA polymerase subunit RPC12/RpoP